MNPNLPITTEINSNGTTQDNTIYVAGRQCSIVGTESPTFRVNGTIFEKSIPSTSFMPIITIRRKAEGVGADVTLDSFDIITTANTEIQICQGGILDPAPAYGSITDSPDEETIVEKAMHQIQSQEEFLCGLDCHPPESRQYCKTILTSI